MEEMNRIRKMLEDNAYTIVENFPGKNEVNLRLGIHMSCPILECQASDREELRLLLKGLNFRIMVRQKDDGIVQFIIRK
ncbi:hypothetical protein [Propionigenium maris]|nr:hypothetical protein [Propionigenium maris]